MPLQETAVRVVSQGPRVAITPNLTDDGFLTPNISAPLVGTGCVSLNPDR